MNISKSKKKQVGSITKTRVGSAKNAVKVKMKFARTKIPSRRIREAAETLFPKAESSQRPRNPCIPASQAISISTPQTLAKPWCLGSDWAEAAESASAAYRQLNLDLNSDYGKQVNPRVSLGKSRTAGAAYKYQSSLSLNHCWL